jgi:polyhydroxyalkanoate synthesis regulator phasin
MADTTARLLSLEELRAQVARLQEEGQKLVGQLRKDAQAMLDRRPVVVRAIEGARKLRTTVQTRAEQALADVNAQRGRAIELVTTQIGRLTDVAVRPLGLAQQREVSDLSVRVTELAQKLAEVERRLAAVQKDSQHAA